MPRLSTRFYSTLGRLLLLLGMLCGTNCSKKVASEHKQEDAPAPAPAQYLPALAGVELAQLRTCISDMYRVTARFPNDGAIPALLEICGQGLAFDAKQAERSIAVKKLGVWPSLYCSESVKERARGLDQAKLRSLLVEACGAEYYGLEEGQGHYLVPAWFIAHRIGLRIKELRARAVRSHPDLAVKLDNVLGVVEVELPIALPDSTLVLPEPRRWTRHQGPAVVVVSGDTLRVLGKPTIRFSSHGASLIEGHKSNSLSLGEVAQEVNAVFAQTRLREKTKEEFVERDSASENAYGTKMASQGETKMSRKEHSRSSGQFVFQDQGGDPTKARTMTRNAARRAGVLSEAGAADATTRLISYPDYNAALIIADRETLARRVLEVAQVLPDGAFLAGPDFDNSKGVLGIAVDVGVGPAKDIVAEVVLGDKGLDLVIDSVPRVLAKKAGSYDFERLASALATAKHGRRDVLLVNAGSTATCQDLFDLLETVSASKIGLVTTGALVRP